MKKSSNAPFDDSGNWNNAKRFSDTKIQGILESLDKYETIARFGFSTPEEKIQNLKLPKEEIDFIRLQGLKYYVSGIIQLLENSDFAVTKEREKFEKYYEAIIIIRDKIIHKLGRETGNKTASIRTKDYFAVLSYVQRIKSKINNPLNKNGLIFINRKEFDLKQAKKDFIENATTKS